MLASMFARCNNGGGGRAASSGCETIDLMLAILRTRQEHCGAGCDGDEHRRADGDLKVKSKDGVKAVYLIKDIEIR